MIQINCEFDVHFFDSMFFVDSCLEFAMKEDLLNTSVDTTDSADNGTMKKSKRRNRGQSGLI